MTVENGVHSAADQVNNTGPAYLSAYGFQRDPFSGEIENDFFYGESDRTQRLNLMTHLAPFGGVILVNGVKGVGKTTLMHQFLARAKESWRISKLDPRPDIDTETLIKQIFDSFSLNVALKAENSALSGLQEQLFALCHNGLSPIIVIDDAHLLSNSVIQILFELTGPVTDDPDKSCATVILFCEPRIVESLFSPELQALRTHIKHSFELTNFSEEQTRKYILHRLRVAGLTGESPFSPSVIKVIYSKSNGLPEKINELARVILTNSVGASDEEPGKPLLSGFSFPGKRVWLSGIAVGVVAAVLVFQDQINRLFDTTSQPKQAIMSGETKAITEPVPDDDNAEKSIKMLREIKSPEPSLVKKDDNVEIISLPEPVQKELKTEPITAQKEGKKDEIPDALQQLLAVKRSEQSGTIAENITKQKPAQKPVVSKPADSQVVVPVAPVAEPVPEAESVPAPAPIARPEPVPEPDDIQDSGLEQIVSVVDVDIPKITVRKTKEDESQQQLHREEWLMRRPPKHYTLQLMANDEEVVISFMKQKDLLQDAAYFHTLSKDKPLYALVLGDYPSLTAARAASQSLSPELGRIKPWIRSFDSVQAAIRTYREQAGPADRAAALSSELPDKQEHMALTDGEKWILEQPSNSYTLQLIAMNSEEAVLKYIESHDIGKEAAYFRKIKEKTVWYSVIYGSYATREDALAASKSLPENFGKISPWVRSFGSIHNAMKGE